MQALQEPQWINCDVRNFDWSILGKFGVIMTDPPWHIRQVCVRGRQVGSSSLANTVAVGCCIAS